MTREIDNDSAKPILSYQALVLVSAIAGGLGGFFSVLEALPEDSLNDSVLIEATGIGMAAAVVASLILAVILLSLSFVRAKQNRD